MASFLAFYPQLAQNEGGWQEDPKDLGNSGKYPFTYAGIAGGFHPTWAGWKAIAAYRNQWLSSGKTLVTRKDWLAFSQVLKTDKELQKSVLSFYESLYWDSLHLDLVTSQSVAEMMADHGVNAGTRRVGYMAQWVLRNGFNQAQVTLDGKIGTQTLKAINSVSAALFHARFSDLRKDFYRYRSGEYNNYKKEPRLLALHHFFRDKLNLKTNPSQRIYLRTWLRRVDDMKFKK